MKLTFATAVPMKGSPSGPLSLVLALLLSLPILSGGTLTTTSITLSSSQNPSVFGHPITLTATVTPSAATGSVTFYDGTTVLESSPLVGGQATLTTALLPSGMGSLKAYYSGDTNYAPSTSAVVSQAVNGVPSAGFAKAVNYGAGSGPWSVAVGDFNGDGKPDLAVANEESNNLSVLLGNGDGTFQAGVNYVAGMGPNSVAVGDFNGDGKLDLAVANAYGGGVSVLLGVNSTNSVSTLTLAPLSNVTFGQPLSLTAAVADVEAFHHPPEP